MVEQERRHGPTVFLVLALAVTLGALLIIRNQLAAVVLALAFGYLLQPVHRWLTGVVRKEWISASILLLLFAVVLVAPFIILTFRFIDDATSLLGSIGSRADVERLVSGFLGALGVPERHLEDAAARTVEEAAAFLFESLAPIASIAAEALVALSVFFFLLFYVILDGPRLARFVEHVMPAPKEDVHRMNERVGHRVNAIVLGMLFVGTVQGTIAGVGWWILGLPAPVFWGFIMVVLSMIPVIGAFIVLIPAAIWTFLQGDMVATVGLLVLNFVLVGLTDNILRPFVIGKRGGVHPSLILLGIIGGIPLFGLSGIVLGPLIMGIVGPLFQVWSHPEDDEGTEAIE